jgi:succinoglycan biosynthesis transport protein ExoP
VAADRPETQHHVAPAHEDRQEADGSGGIPGPVQAVLRRWPLVIVGLIIGLACGALLHVTSTRFYRSTAQLLVVKSRETGTAQENRIGMVDDYVQAQIYYIQSERIRRAAVLELRKSGQPTGLSDDEGEAAAQLSAGLAVTKDVTGATAGINNGIVNLAYRGTNPTNTELYLTAVIAAYQGSLTTLYSTSTQRAIDNFDAKRKVLVADREVTGKTFLSKQLELNKITAEDLAIVRGRVSTAKEREYQLTSELAELDSKLQTIKQAGPNRRDRVAAFSQITGVARGAGDGLKVLELRRSALGERLGKDHPDMKEVDAQIAFQSQQIAEQNPADPKGRSDELRQLELYTEYRADVNRKQLRALTTRLIDDQQVLSNAGQLAAEITQLQEQLRQAELNIREIEAQKNIIVATKSFGGFEATAITPPHYGAQVAPVLMQSILMGLVIGVLISAAAVGVAEFSDRSFRTPAEIRKRLGVPVIGHIPFISAGTPADSGTPAGLLPTIVTALRPKSNAAETYRGVRTQLYFSTQGRGHQVIQVTSPSPGDGKSTLAANLAVVVAQSGKRVVLLDCDFRKPQVHKIFGLGKVEAGLADVVAGAAPMAKALRRSGVDGLDLMPCGTRPTNPAELLTSPRFQQLLADLRDAYDFVIVDTPPVLAVSDPGNVAARVDGVILVFRLTKNSRPAAERAYESLHALGVNILGVVVNAGDAGGRGYGGYGGYGDYNYGGRYGYRYTDYQYSESYVEADADVAPAGRA